MNIRILIAIALSSLAFAAEPTPAPDYKALYEKANEAARLWKEKAEASASECAGLKARLAEAEARVAAWQGREFVRLRAEASAEQSAADAKAAALRGAQREWIYGRVLSVLKDGVLVRTTIPAMDRREAYRAVPAESVVFLEMDTTGVIDRDPIDAIGGGIGEYGYTQANGALATVRRYAMAMKLRDHVAKR